MKEMTWTTAPPSTAITPISTPFMGSSPHSHSQPFANPTVFPGFDFRLSSDIESSDSSSAYSTPTTATAVEVWSYSSMPVNHNSNSSSSIDNHNGYSSTSTESKSQQNQIARMAELRSLDYANTKEYSCDTPTMEACSNDALSQRLRNNADQPQGLLQAQSREALVLSRSNHGIASSSSPTRSVHSSHSHPLATTATTTATVTSIPTTAIMSPSPSQQHLNAQQYLTMMNEAASRIRALTDDQQQSSASPLLPPSNSLYNTSQWGDFVSQPPSSNSVAHNYHPAYQNLSHLALRRTQSMGVFAPQIPSLSLSTGTMTNASSPDSPMVMLLPRHHSPLHSAGTPQSARPRHNPYNDYFGPSNASTSSSLSPSPVPTSTLVGGASADSNLDLGIDTNMHMMAATTAAYSNSTTTATIENHRVHIPVPIPMALTGSSSPVLLHTLKGNRQEFIVSSPSLPSSLSLALLSSSSSSTSPSPSSPSPLMLSSSSSSTYSFSSSPSSSLAVASSGRHRRLSIMTNTSSTFASVSGAMSSPATNSSSPYYNFPTSAFYEHYKPVPASQSPSNNSNNSHNNNKGASTSDKSNSINNKKSKARYVCKIPDCHRTFSRPFNLKSHGLTHETHRPHACGQCPKTFARIHDRDRHSKGHLLEKAHSCIVCLGRFARQDAVTRHLKLANEQNPCASILKSRGVSFREAAAGRVKRSALGEEGVIRRWLEGLEERARKARASKNLEMGMMNMNMDLNMNVTVGMGSGSGRGAMEVVMDGIAGYELNGIVGHANY